MILIFMKKKDYIWTFEKALKKFEYIEKELKTSKTGTDDVSTTGNINDPFNSLNYAISRVSGIINTVFIREGSYEEPLIEINNDDFLISAYNNENVIFDGTRSINDLRENSSDGN